MARKTNAGNDYEHQSRQRECNDEMARNGERVRHHAKQIENQHENEQREDERKILHPVLAGVLIDHIGNEFVGDFSNRLQPCRDQCPLARRKCQKADNQNNGQHHEQR